MVEGSKQVRVDNWGIFFLQRLQMFFSKTDYCDLTLQFEGNVQLKVHRLVMNACTEYFSFLEESYPSMEESTIMMPSDLQADVIVPIVNFMYTGMLEFHSTIFEKLYHASEVMSLTVLTKLLDAQKQKAPTTPPPAPKKKSDIPNQWLPPKKSTPKVANNSELPATLPGRKLPVWKRKMVPHYTEHKWSTNSEPMSSYNINTPKPTRFEWPDDDLPSINPLDTSFEEFSYTSKPLLTQEEEIRSGTFNRASSSKGNDNNTLPDFCIFEDEDVSELGQKRKLDQYASKVSPKRLKLNDKENKETTFNIKSNNSADLDHTKIVSEILKKYPDLVKKNKNIRLKIMSPGNKTSTPEKKVNSITKVKIQEETQIKCAIQKQPKKPKLKKRLSVPDEGPWICEECSAGGGNPQEFILYYLYRKHMTDEHGKVFDMRLCKYCGRRCGKHRLMMYHLFVKHGLKPPSSYEFPKCDRCPYIGLSIPRIIQHQRRHRPEEAQCLDCKLAFCNQAHLTTHMRASSHPNIENRPSHYDCQYCTKRMPSAIGLLGHVRQSHIKDAARDGMIGLEEELDDDEEEEDEEEVKEEEEYIVPEVGVEAEVGELSRDKVKIISNVKVTDNQQSLPTHQLIPAEPSSEAEALNNVASGIATSLGLVDIVVLDDDRQYVLRPSGEGNQEFVLPSELAGNSGFAGQVITTQHSTALQQSVLQTTGSEIGSTDELVMVLTDHDYQDEQEGGTTDNSNIVVLYSHPVDGQQGQFITSQGNLLVNSQTGMLEIRNGATTISTNPSNQIIVNTPAAAPIESIEMIQREIESHNEMKPEPYFEEESKSDSQTQPVPVTETRMDQTQETIDHPSEDVDHLTETDQHNQETSNPPEDLHNKEIHNENTHGGTHTVDTHNEDTHTEDSHTEDSHTEDSHTEDSHTEDTHTANTHTEDTHTADTHSGDAHTAGTRTEDTLTVDTHTEEEQPVKDTENVEIVDLTENHKDQQAIQEDNVTENDMEKEHVEPETNVKESIEPANDGKDSVDGVTNLIEQEPMEVDEIIETENSIVESNESKKEQTVIENEEDISPSEPITEDKGDKSSEDVAPSKETESSFDAPPEPKQQLPVEESKENAAPCENIVNDSKLEYSSDSDIVRNTCEPMEVDGKVLNLEADTHEEPIEENSTEEVHVAEQDNEIHVADQDKETLSELRLKQNKEQEQQVENADPGKEVVQEEEDDENSSQSKVVEETNKNQASINQTILDDWEDTDSQQSEKPHSDLDKDDEAMKEAAENVNKLMDDWEEEEEEDKTDAT